uniref:CRAL-TRIO domain-containing protein n=1 Tax=Alexandrium catenella TaxID=2925 RepID=A0A7S1WR55_ALECA
MLNPRPLLPIGRKASAPGEGRTKAPAKRKDPLPASYCGFRALPEPEAAVFACQEHNVSDFSLPAEALTFEPSAEMVTAKFRNGDSERRVHCNSELTPFEQEKLGSLQREAEVQHRSFYPSVAAMATRFLSRARNDHRRALDLMQATQAWREDYFKDGPITDTSVEEDMRHGIVYFTGRDSDLRPALVVRGNRIPEQWYRHKRVDKLIRILIFCMEYFLRYMVVPGKVENLCVIVDLKGLALSQVQLGGLSEIYKVMSHHYIGRVFRFYVCNMPVALGMVAGMAKALLTDRQKQKVVMVSDVSKLREEFALHQLESDLGGSRSPVEQFFPFPLQPGPFRAGCALGPDGDAVRGAHRVLTRLGAVGRLWSPARSREQNLALELEDGAAAILTRCGISIPDSHDEAEGSETPSTAEAESEDAPRRENTSMESCSEAFKQYPAGLGADISTEAGSRVADEVLSFGSEREWPVFDDDRHIAERQRQDMASFLGKFGFGSCWCSAP